MKTNNESKAIARAIHGWLTSYLPESRNFSRNTVKAYKDGITLYATFLQNVKSVSPENLSGACFSKGDSHLRRWRNTAVGTKSES
jgi:site-specific recombinase XerD